MTTQLFSGPVQVGVDSVVTNTLPSVNVDGVCLSDPQPQYSVGVPPGPQPPVTIAGCAAWPCTASHEARGSENSLADVAQYYYRTDLRPGSRRRRPRRAAGTDAEADNATHQHMTTFVVGLGVSGTLNYRSDYRSRRRPAISPTSGRPCKRWPLWPDPSLDYSNSDNYNNKKSIDDYWHTAVNGRGLFFSADNPTSVINGLGDALSARSTAWSPPAPPTRCRRCSRSPEQLRLLDELQAGSVVRRRRGRASIRHLVTGPARVRHCGLVGQGAVDAKITNACDNTQIYVIHNGNTLSDFTWNTRNAARRRGPTGITARRARRDRAKLLQPAQRLAAQPIPFMTDGTGVTVAQQQRSEGSRKAGQLPARPAPQRGFTVGIAHQAVPQAESVLGDIIDSQPVYVQAPFANYAENGYDTFKAANAGRTPMLYVGANDGMLHAFYATENMTDPLAGTEAWAVIPSAVLPNLYKLADSSYSRGQHEFLVDGTPVVGDAFIGGAWKTILVGGLNAGGKGYYALDVTNAGALPVPLWEFKQDSAQCPAPRRGGRQQVRLQPRPHLWQADHHQAVPWTWVVMFTSGYNNVNGAGNGHRRRRLPVRPRCPTGTIIHKIATAPADGATPSGLAQINNYVDNGRSTTRRCALTAATCLATCGASTSCPPIGTLLGTAKDSAAAIEPITVRPELAELNGKPFVMFGTAACSVRPTSPTCKSNPCMDSLTRLSARDRSTPIRSAIHCRPIIFRRGRCAGATRTTSCSGTTAECGRPAGWVLDLGEPGERVNVEMHLLLGALVFTSNVPKLIPCDVGGHVVHSGRLPHGWPGVYDRSDRHLIAVSCPTRSM